MSLYQNENIKPLTENLVNEDHIVNMFFRNTLINPEAKESLIKNNPHNIKHLEIIQKQNSLILNSSASHYDNFQEKFENLSKSIIRLEEKIKNLDRIDHNNTFALEIQEKIEYSEKVEKGDTLKTKLEIDEELEELQKNIDNDDKKLADLKFVLDNLIKKIQVDEELIHKISQEKKSILDSISESYIIDLTYRDEFLHNYQYDLMEIILENLNKMSFKKIVTEKINSEFTAQYDPQLIQTNIDSERKKMIIKDFKNSCFNAWKFKNQLLCIEGLNVISESDIRQLRERIDKMITSKDIESSEDDSSYEFFFEPLYKLLKIFLFLTVGSKRISVLKSKLKTLDSETRECKIRIAENNGKKNLLLSIKAKIKDGKSKEDMPLVSKNHINVDKSDIHHEMKSFLKDLKNVKNSFQKDYNSLLKQLGDKLVKPQQLNN